MLPTGGVTLIEHSEAFSVPRMMNYGNHHLIKMPAHLLILLLWQGSVPWCLGSLLLHD